MTQARKRRGMRTQAVVAEAVRRVWPYAESTGAGRQGADVLGTPGVDIEVAARRGLPIVEKMRQLRERQQDGVTGAVVLRPDGMGEATVDDWPVFMRLADWLDVMKSAGYGGSVERHGQAVGLPLAREGTDFDGTRVVEDPIVESFRCACGAPAMSGSHSADQCALPGPATL